MINKQERIRFERIISGGSALGRLASGKVCFVPFALPDEEATVRILREKNSFAEAEIVELHESRSSARITPRCPYFGQCGGCQYQHIDYTTQLTIKREHVADALRRIGGFTSGKWKVESGKLDNAAEGGNNNFQLSTFNFQLPPTLPSPQPWGYRNRISVHTRAGRTGFFRPRSNYVVDVARCELASEEVNAHLAKLRATRPRDGERTLREAAQYRGFRQVNDGAAQLLRDTVESFLPERGATLVDAYCGAGFFAEAFAPRFDAVYGIEWSASAIAYAREHASANCRYIEGDVALHLAEVLAAVQHSGDSGKSGESNVLRGEAANFQLSTFNFQLPTTLLLDPPATGCAPAVLDAIVATPPETLIYISCDPATLARDLKALSSKYTLKTAQPIDMFPQTAQIEVVAHLARIL